LTGTFYPISEVCRILGIDPRPLIDEYKGIFGKIEVQKPSKKSSLKIVVVPIIALIAAIIMLKSYSSYKNSATLPEESSLIRQPCRRNAFSNSGKSDSRAQKEPATNPQEEQKKPDCCNTQCNRTVLAWYYAGWKIHTEVY